MAKDPVCGMDVDEKTAAATAEYQGKTYYFCAPGCKKAFEKEPEKYVQGTASSSHTTRLDADADTCARHSWLPEAGAVQLLPLVVSPATKIQQTFSGRAIADLWRRLSAERYVTPPTPMKSTLETVGRYRG